MFLINFAKDFARFASIAAFLCFVVAHLECPDMIPQPSDDTILANCRLNDRGEPPLVDAGVADDLGVERYPDRIAVTNSDN
jgi:hypothetical protein